MEYPELHKHNNGDIIIHKLPQVGAVRAAWIHAILEDRKQ